MATRYFDFKEYAAGEQITEDGFDADTIDYEVSVAIFKDIRAYENNKKIIMSDKKRAKFAEFWVATHTSYVMRIIHRNFNPIAWLVNYVKEEATEANEWVRRVDVTKNVFNALHGKKITEEDVNDFMEGVIDVDTSNGVYNGLIEYVKAWASTLPAKRG